MLAGADESGLPVRLLDGFALMDGAGQPVSLEGLKEASQAVVEGALVLPDERSVPAKSAAPAELLGCSWWTVGNHSALQGKRSAVLQVWKSSMPCWSC